MLCLVGGPLVALRVALPDHLAMGLELVVGAMLVFLGVRALRQHPHEHTHAHEAPLHVRGRRPFAIGIMHGLAGSGALAALIALGAPTVATGLLCLGLYAFGTVVGMVALAALAGPMLSHAGRFPSLAAHITKVAGVASIVMGVVWTLRTLLS